MTGNRYRQCTQPNPCDRKLSTTSKRTNSIRSRTLCYSRLTIMLKFSVASRTNGTLRKIPWSNRWVVQEPFVWYVDYLNKGKAIIVPAGFWTDFWSIPRILHSVLSPTQYISYILHDYLYTFWPQLGITRKEADLILAEALRVEGMNKVKIKIVYLWVRMFWGKKYTRE